MHHGTIDRRRGPALAGRAAPGDHTLLDVRQDWEYAEAHLPGAVHVPLGELDRRLGELAPGRPTVVYCRSGSRSAAAAAMLAAHGFGEVFNLKGGILAWNGAVAAGPGGAGLHALPAGGPPALVLARAWRMEAALGDFYAAVADAAPPEAAALLRRLAGFEERHKARLLELCRKTPGCTAEDGGPQAAPGGGRARTARTLRTPRPQRRAGARRRPSAGRRAHRRRILALHGAEFADPRGVLEAGMMFEAQAMDLYARCAARAENPEARALFGGLADEERGHLKALGALLDRMGRG
jgi:rhodanese-related sulfurtransferase/rubrerythrin